VVGRLRVTADHEDVRHTPSVDSLTAQA
jgi:hypothetical protein